MKIRPLITALLALHPFYAHAQSPQDWRTPAEISDYRTTPDYAETIRLSRPHRGRRACPGQDGRLCKTAKGAS